MFFRNFQKNNIFYSSFLEVSLQISEVSRSSHLICFKFKYNLLQLLPVPVHLTRFISPWIRIRIMNVNPDLGGGGIRIQYGSTSLDSGYTVSMFIKIVRN